MLNFFLRCGYSNIGQSPAEILEEYVKIQEFKPVIGKVESLLELCLRNAPGINSFKCNNLIHFHLYFWSQLFKASFRLKLINPVCN